MKKLTLGCFLVIFLVACGKDSSKPEEEEKTKEPEKIISEVRAASEYLLSLKSAENYVGLEYFKNYADKDEVILEVKDQKASLISEAVSENSVGTKMLFKLPQLNEIGDLKIKIKIKNNQKTIEGEGTIRVVNDFSLNTVWNSLDRDYVSTRYFYINRMKNGDLNFQQIAFTSQDEFFLGFYLKNFGNFNTYESKLFIPGLPGRYSAVYNGKNVQQIKISNGDKLVDQNFDVAKFYDELTSIYGTGTIMPQTNSNKVTIYKSGTLQLSVTETPSTVSTVITKI